MSKAVKKLPQHLSGIATMERPALVDLWYDTHNAPPPKNLSAVFLRRALAFEAQCHALGGHKLRTLKLLKPPATGAPKPKAGLPIGAQLVREWNGRTYRVEVTAAGFEMAGTPYPSLSAIAKHITGAHWSGPRFFGLIKRTEAA